MLKAAPNQRDLTQLKRLREEGKSAEFVGQRLRIEKAGVERWFADLDKAEGKQDEADRADGQAAREVKPKFQSLAGTNQAKQGEPPV